MAGHRYWRIYSDVNMGDGYTQFAEVEMRITAGGADQCSGGTAGGSPSIQAGSYAGAFANDNSTSFCQWSASFDIYISYDFGVGVTKDIVEVAITGATGDVNRGLKAGIVQYSDDGSTWFDSWRISNVSAYTLDVFKVFTKPTATSAYRYWRARFENCISNCYAIAQMRMHTAVGGSDVCTGGTPISYSGTAADSFDANTTTFGFTGSLRRYEYLGYDFGSGNTKQIVEIGLMPRQDAGNYTQWPGNLAVEASSDGINWLQIHTVRACPNPYNGSTATYSYFVNPANATGGSTHRWWGIRANSVQSGTGVGLAELEFRASPGGASYATGGIAASPRPYSGNWGEYAFDGTANAWGSTVAADEIIGYDFGSGNFKSAPVQIMIKARSATLSNFNQSPTSFDLVYSDDGHNWTTQQTYTSPATWTADEVRLFGVVPGTRRRQIILIN